MSMGNLLLNMFEPLVGKSYKYLVKVRVEEIRDVIRTYEVDAKSVEDAKKRYFCHGIITESVRDPDGKCMDSSRSEVISVKPWRKSYYKDRYMIIVRTKGMRTLSIARWDLTYKQANKEVCELKEYAKEWSLANPNEPVYDGWWVMKMEPNFGEEY